MTGVNKIWKTHVKIRCFFMAYCKVLKWTFQKQSREVFCKKGALRNFAKFTWKHLCQSLFLNKVAGIRLLRKAIKKETLEQVFSCEYCEISKNTFLQNTSRRLLLSFYKKILTNLMSEKRKYKKIHFRRKKGKHGTEGNELKMLFTVTEGLAAVFAGELCNWYLTGF